MAYTSGSYQAVTILSLLLGAGFLIWMVVTFTQNQSKLAIVDTFTHSLKGPVSSLGLGNPNPGSATSSHSASLKNSQGEQLAFFLSSPNILTWSSPNGTANMTLQ
jgi:hypothetical protein